MASRQNTNNKNKRLMTLEHAAEYLDTSEKTLRRRISEGKITGYRFGARHIRVDMNEIEATLKPIPSA